MNNVIRSWCVCTSEAGEQLVWVELTRESNGIAVWWHHRNHDARLLSWTSFTPSRSTEAALADATAEAASIADAALVRNGALSAKQWRFTQR